MKIGLSLLLVPLISLTSLAQERKTTIVFVCEHGGARSTIASLYFNKIAQENHLPYHSFFRGLTPDSVISKETEKGLRADGFETQSLSPVALSLADTPPGALLISLDCALSPPYQTFRAWNKIPAISENYSAARNEIIHRLKELIIELKNKK